MAVEAQTIGGWTVDVLIKVVKDILENQPTTSFQHLKVDDLEIVRRLVLRDAMEADRNSLRKIGQTGEPAFEHSWTNFDTATAPAGYWRDPFGIVHLQGLIKSGTVGQSAFTLPPGYRPAWQHPFGTVSNGAVGRVDVFADGTVVPASPSNNAWVALDGMQFRAA